MRRALLLSALMASASPLLAQDAVHHHLTVRLDPAAHRLHVADRITLPEGMGRDALSFVLSDVLKVENSSIELQSQAGEEGLTRYQITGDASELVLEYGGRFDFGLSDEKEEYTRGFRESRGVVGPEGVYLHGESAWVPSFGEHMLSFRLDVEAPQDWHVVSQGGGDSAVAPGRAHWESEGLLEQVYLVGGPLTRISDSAGDVQTLVYLHEQDQALAAKYLEATAQYLAMYSDLIGPYPYSKFALVENFWETGYGMPSFTLLGPEVIRLPFILHSSYPHEILHNWWGNSVFVDYESGNWCEGLTAYLADHLISEQRGKGAEYRRSTLQKYRDYVQEGHDFPLNEFRSRHSAATEAVGYGKASMTFHMLRRLIGDESFSAGLRRFYADNRGRRATFGDFRKAMEAESKRDLEDFFAQWVDRVGAPQLELTGVKSETIEDGFVLVGQIEQIQAEAPFALQIPLVVFTAQGSLNVTINQEGPTSEFRIPTDSAPVGLAVDPLFDLFRVLDPRETPASIGQIFGEPAVLAVLPDGDDSIEAYRELASGWQSDVHDVQFALDSELEALPADRAVWVLGRNNRFAASLTGTLASVEVDANGVTLAGEKVPYQDHSLVVVARHPLDLERATGWIVLDPESAAPGLARKLPHYGKYSYLAFQGEEPTNVVKGQWGTEGSPMVVSLTNAPLSSVKDDRSALAETPPVFSAARLKEHVDWLASPERKGRGLGTPELEASADYIASAFAEIGLEPAGDNHGWFQEFTVSEGPDGHAVQAKNVVGIIRGQRADWSDQSFVLGAHFDHLGLGWPDSHAADAGQIHPGADDNASGVSVLIELARQLVAAGGGSRNLVVVAFSAEECGLLGSEHYLSSPRFPLEGIRGMINLDTVGRLDDGAISIHGTGTADEWQHIFRGAGFVTGIANKIVPEMAEGSDQWSFIQAGIPAVQIFTRATADYHRASDTPDKIKGQDLVQVAAFVREGVVYMLEREEPLTTQLGDSKTTSASSPQGPSGSASGSASGSGRRVSFGSIPDFAFEGEGMRFEGVTPDSPAAKADLRADDILIQIDQTEIKSLRDFSNCLKTLAPGQTVTAVVLRDDEKVTAEVTLVAR